MKKLTATILLWTAFSLVAYGSHIVGGRVYYDHIQGNTYKITLKIYRDCYNGEAPFDDPAYVTLYKQSTMQFHEVVTLSDPSISNVPVIINDPCLSAPPNICVQEAIYDAIVTLPSEPQGYIITHQRCCRNKTIENLETPNEQGATYYTTIPSVGNNNNNSSPEFAEWPPIAICANKPFNFDHSANDPDGDSLAYSLCAPLKGAKVSDPFPERAQAPPYESVDYATNRGFSATYPVTSSPQLKIDPETGMITGTPTIPGQYVVGVCVKEYRNGKLISEGFRDFQFNVTNCEKNVNAEIKLAPGDTAISNCKDFQVSFQNNSTGTNSYHWDFGVEGTTDDESTAKNPTYTFPDTGTYRVRLIAEPGGVCSDTDFVSVKIYPVLEADFSVLDTCPDDSLPLQDLTTNAYGSVVEWEWSFGDGNVSYEQHPIHHYEKGGAYNIHLNVVNEYGCESQASNRVNIFPKPNSRFEVDEHCLHQPVKINYLSTIDSGSITKTIWDFDNGTMDTGLAPSMTYQVPGTYSIKLIETSSRGCHDTLEREVKVRPITEAKVNDDTTICANDAIQLYASGGFYYEWRPPGDYRQNINNPFVHPGETTTYTVHVDDGCYEDSAEVTIHTKPKPDLQVSNDTVIFKGGEAVLWAKGNADKYEWDPKQYLQTPYQSRTTARPVSTTIYEVAATALNGCVQKEQVKVEVRPECAKLYIPNAFTPNGDGLNDAFYPKNYGDGRLKEMRIYSRWGQQVFHTTTAEAGWDGNFQGEPMPMGTYVYTIVFECGSEEINYKGNLHLIR